MYVCMYVYFEKVPCSVMVISLEMDAATRVQILG